ncbi:MAG: hypothetical protein V7L23_32115 [Nostoc sp.]|uniref:hypothetical protein n=1 Tax=Nostoc sp. TaxID=1180 RepID=UPI002FF30E80
MPISLVITTANHWDYSFLDTKSACCFTESKQWRSLKLPLLNYQSAIIDPSNIELLLQLLMFCL